MPDRVILTHRNQEGPLRRRGAEDPAQLRAARAVRTGRGRLLGADRHARHAAPLRLELQPLLRHEGPALDRSREDVQGDEVGSRLPEGRRARARQHLVARSRATARRISGAASSRRRSSGAATAAIPGRWSRASATTSTRASGSPGNGGLCMHTILRDGNRVHLGISTGGHYLSEDGGETLHGVQQGRRRRLRARSLSRVRPVRAQDRGPQGRARPALHAEPRRLGRMGRARRAAAGHRRAAQRRPRPDVALDRQGAAVRLRLPDRRAPARPRHGLRHAARADDAHLPGRRARGLAQRERRRLVEAARAAGCRRRRASSRSSATRWTSTS